MKDPGDLLYCKKRGNIRCCFENAVCTEFMEWGSDDLEEATSYLNETLAYLNGLVKSTGYSSCHHLGTSLDASKCAKDCEKLKKKILLRIALHTVDYLSVVLEEIRHVAMSAGKDFRGNVYFDCVHSTSLEKFTLIESPLINKETKL